MNNNKKNNTKFSNEVYNNIFARLIHDIRNNIKLTDENKDFIEYLPNNKKMEIILLYDEVIQKNNKISEDIKNFRTLK